MTPLRQRMIEDLQLKSYSEKPKKCMSALCANNVSISKRLQLRLPKRTFDHTFYMARITRNGVAALAPSSSAA